MPCIGIRDRMAVSERRRQPARPVLAACVPALCSVGANGRLRDRLTVSG